MVEVACSGFGCKPSSNPSGAGQQRKPAQQVFGSCPDTISIFDGYGRANEVERVSKRGCGEISRYLRAWRPKPKVATLTWKFVAATCRCLETVKPCLCG